MKLGFNAITDEAREKLEELGVVYQRILAPNGMSMSYDVYTESYDLKEQSWRDGPWDWIAYPGDQREYESQGFRTWKHPDTDDYYMWIHGVVFRKFSIKKVDHRFDPPTVFVTDVLDYDPVDESYRDKLLMIRPMAESGFFQ